MADAGGALGRLATRVARKAARPVMGREDSRLGAAIGDWASRRVLERLIATTDELHAVRWLGRPVWQFPQDIWLIQEMISELRPEVILETGTHRGGSAFFYATLCDLLGGGEVVSVDIAPIETVPHPRITYVTGSSVDDAVVEHVRELVGGRDALVILDSDHSAAHVRRELDAYARLAPVGSYVHVQDGGIDTLSTITRHPATGEGPLPAIRDFLAANPSYVRDRGVEQRYVMTAHPYGWLRRVAD